ncbi:hypothetical protein HW115_18595 [Verrucomicrobiaceae bacterium N1E253]|uniref:Uncharacterized protein n=1 Tax=Oceaniferula marina TaxID=2748318 RepID=A0A851GJE2_9BACT|nr:hypothetical protein [Oceaniferula marina]NWK57633.1 hypothetical protein [Oceaniferula marina]
MSNWHIAAGVLYVSQKMKKVEHMNAVCCEKCGKLEPVRPKLIATHVILNASSWQFPELRMSHQVVDEEKFLSSPYVQDRNFVSALFCDDCGLGFIPESELEEMGIAHATSR